MRGLALGGEQLQVSGGAPTLCMGKGRGATLDLGAFGGLILLSHPGRAESWTLGRRPCA